MIANPPEDLAILVGDKARMEAMISQGTIDIHRRMDSGVTLLMLAVARGSYSVVRLLLKHGANVALVEALGRTALHYSTGTGRLDVTICLVEAGANIEAVENSGYTPLHCACASGSPMVVEKLVELGAVVDRRLPAGGTAMYLAAQEGQEACVSVLLRANADPSLGSMWPTGTLGEAYMYTPLDVAAQRGWLEVVRVIVENVGIKTSSGPSGGTMALKCAMSKGRLDVISYLCHAGALDVDAQALCMAALGGHEAVAKIMLGILHYSDGALDGALFASLTRVQTSGVSPRMTRLILDHHSNGASTNILLAIFEGKVSRVLKKKSNGKKLKGLDGIRRLLQQKEAIHANSWLWPAAGRAPAKNKALGPKVSGPMVDMLPVLRRRVAKPLVLLTALHRFNGKLDGSLPGGVVEQNDS